MARTARGTTALTALTALAVAAALVGAPAASAEVAAGAGAAPSAAVSSLAAAAAVGGIDGPTVAASARTGLRLRAGDVRGVRGGERSGVASERGGYTTAATDAGSPRPAAEFVQRFEDFCRDASRAGVLDLADADLLDDGAAQVVVAWGACGRDVAADAEVVFVLTPLVGTGGNPSHLVSHRTDGAWDLVDTAGSPDAGDWVVVQSGSAPVELFDRRASGFFEVDAAGAGLPAEYYLDVLVFDAGGAVVDRLPELDMPPLVVPHSCAHLVDGTTGGQARTTGVRTSTGASRAEVHPARGAAPTGAGTHARASTVRTTGPVATAALAGVLRGAGYWVGAVGRASLQARPALLDPAQVLALPGVVGVDATVGHVRTVSDDPRPTAWAQQQLRLPQAWGTFGDGAKVTVAVVDDGVNGTLADFSGRVVAGLDAVTGSVLPAGGDSSLGSHGTSVASVVAALHGDATRTAGVNNAARVWPGLVADHGGCIDAVAVAAALDGAVAAQVDVVNLSLGGPDDAALRGAVQRAVDAGIVVLAATGNGGPAGGLAYPAGHPGVVGVGATGPGGDTTGYSTAAGTDVRAPGGDSSGTGRDVDGVDVLDRHGRAVVVDGTSFATPYVAGVVSLAGAGALTSEQARDALLASAGPNLVVDAAAFLQWLGAGGSTIGDTSYPLVVLHDQGATCDQHQGEANAYRDVDGIFDQAVRCIRGLGVTQGFPDGTFRPGGTLTRGQAAAFLVRALALSGHPLPAPGEAPDAYSDDDGTRFEDDLDRLATVIPAQGPRIRPGAAITRDRLAEWVGSVLRRAAGEPAGDVTWDWFGDDDDNPRERWIDTLAAYGVAAGTSRGSFDPTGELTRGQMAALLARTVSLLVEDDGGG